MDLTPIYWTLSGLLAGLYLLRVADPPGRTRTMLKTLSVLGLALVALMGGGYLLLVLALALCAAGDAFLAQTGEKSLQAGMLAFGLGTLPSVGGGGLLLRRLSLARRNPLTRTIAGLAVMGLGILGLLKSGALAAALGQGLACIV